MEPSLFMYHRCKRCILKFNDMSRVLREGRYEVICKECGAHMVLTIGLSSTPVPDPVSSKKDRT